MTTMPICWWAMPTLLAGAADARHGARRAVDAAALPFGLFGAAARAAALDERLSELAELDLRLVGLGQPRGVGLDVGGHFAQK